MVRPGTASCLIRIWGRKNEWMTSDDLRWMRAVRFLTKCRSLTVKRSSWVLSLPSGPGYRITHWNCRPVISASGGTLGAALRNLMLAQVPIW